MDTGEKRTGLRSSNLGKYSVGCDTRTGGCDAYSWKDKRLPPVGMWEDTGNRDKTRTLKRGVEEGAS